MIRSWLFLWCLVFRIVNAVVVKTYFDPDEFWQGPEVAHRIVFGYGHLTWEWAAKIRSVLHPLILSPGYWLLKILSMDCPWAVVVAPRLIQAVFVAMCDVSVFGIANKLFGKEVARLALFCQMTSWFNFYCLIRTYSSSMEACLVAIVFNCWPSLTETGIQRHKMVPVSGRPIGVFLAGVCTVLRPTSAMLWIPIGLMEIACGGAQRWKFVFNEVIPLAVLVVGGSLVADRCFYQIWTFPPWQFIKMNQLDGIANIYGTHPWHWYFTQGFLAMLGPMAICLVIGWYCSRRRSGVVGWAMWYLICHSFASHKEFRFVQPALVLCMPYCGLGLSKLKTCCSPKKETGGGQSERRKKEASGRTGRCEWKHLVWRIGVLLGFVVNLFAAIYLSRVHQSGSISSLQYLGNVPKPELKGVMFLMPCHSMPLYSSLHTNVPMRFLDCSPPGWAKKVAEMNSDLGTVATPNEEAEPPVDFRSEEVFFLSNPTGWLEKNLLQGKYSHIIGCDSIMMEVMSVLNERGFYQQEVMFNSHTDMYGWQCNTIIVAGS